MKDTKVPFGIDSSEIILRHVKELDIPVCFDFPEVGERLVVLFLYVVNVGSDNFDSLHAFSSS